MAATSNSNDAADIFWPGYVDAVTNLAINLLFVIAVMSIITLATSLELMKKPKNLDTVQEGGGKADDKLAMAEALEQAQQKLIEAKEAAAKDAAAAKKEIAKLEAQQAPQAQQAQQAPQAQQKLIDVKEAAAKDAAADKKEIAKLEAELAKQAQQAQQAQQKLIDAKEAAAKDAAAAKKEIAKLEAQLAKQAQQSKDSKAAAASSDKSAESSRVETVTAKQVTTMPDGKALIRPVDGGLVVAFEANVVQLSDEEASDVVKKLATFGPLTTSKWQIAVVTPKGYTVASRVAFYRVNAVRSVLLKNGVPGGSIETKVVESEQPTANNARVTVQRIAN